MCDTNMNELDKTDDIKCDDCENIKNVVPQNDCNDAHKYDESEFKNDANLNDKNAKCDEHKLRNNSPLTKMEGLLMFIILLLLISVIAISQKFTDINTYVDLHNEIDALEDKIDIYQDAMKDMPININLKIDGLDKEYIYDSNSGEIVEDDITSDQNENFDTRPFLGVAFDEETLASTPLGLKIAYVYDYSPAKFAGIKSGDIITNINGVAINTFDELDCIISQYNANDDIQIELATISDSKIEFVSKTVTLTYRGNFDLGDD